MQANQAIFGTDPRVAQNASIQYSLLFLKPSGTRFSLHPSTYLRAFDPFIYIIYFLSIVLSHTSNNHPPDLVYLSNISSHPLQAL